MVSVPRFLLEDHFARYKQACRHNLTSSDVQGLGLLELVDMMDPEVRGMWDRATLGYGPTRGHDLLREQIAATYEAATADDVHVFSGATEAIHDLINVIVHPGDHVVVIGPIYQLLADLPRIAGAAITQVPLRAEEAWGLDVDRVYDAITPRTTLIIVNFPNNPTGSLPDRATFAELVAVAGRAGARVLSDELYRGIESDDDRLPAGVDASPDVISVSGVSKVYGLAGARVGWVASRDAGLMDDIRTYRYWTSLSNSVPSEILALAALRSSSVLLERGRSIVAANRARLGTLVDANTELLGWVPPRAGTTSYPWLRHGSATALAEILARDFSIFVAPSSVMPSAGEHLRIGLGRTDMSAGLDRLDDALGSATIRQLLAA